MSPPFLRAGLQLLALLWLLGTQLTTACAEGLNEAEVPVAGQDAVARSAAAADALAEVFVKTSGSRRVLDNPVVAAALRDADRLLVQFYFTRLEYPARSDGPTEELGLHAVFSPQAVASVLQRAGEPLLPPNRPVTLLWLAIDDGAATGPRLLDRDTDAVLGAWLQFHAAQRGLVLRFPEMDMQDSMAVDVSQVWALDAPALGAASARYGAGPMLLAKLVARPDGPLSGEWLYLDGEQESAGQGAAASVEALAAEAVGFAAEAIAVRYAVRTDESQGEQLRVRIDGLDAFRAYYRVYRQLREMKSVHRVQLALVDRDAFFFDLTTASDLETVLRELSLLPQLQPLGDATEAHYRWSGS